MGRDIRVQKGSRNVLTDLAFGEEEAGEEFLKAELGAEIFWILEHRRLTQTKAASIMGVKQPEISMLKNGRFSYYSVERLMRFLERLNCEVSIHIDWPENKGATRVIAI